MLGSNGGGRGVLSKQKLFTPSKTVSTPVFVGILKNDRCCIYVSKHPRQGVVNRSSTKLRPTIGIYWVYVPR